MASCSKYYVIKYKYKYNAGGPSTSTSSKYSRTKLHNLEHFTKVLGFTDMHRVKVEHTEQLVLDST